jgi:hypothetical protein
VVRQAKAAKVLLDLQLVALVGYPMVILGTTVILVVLVDQGLADPTVSVVVQVVQLLNLMPQFLMVEMLLDSARQAVEALGYTLMLIVVQLGMVATVPVDS